MLAKVESLGEVSPRVPTTVHLLRPQSFEPMTPCIDRVGRSYCEGVRSSSLVRVVSGHRRYEVLLIWNRSTLPLVTFNKKRTILYVPLAVILKKYYIEH